MIIGKTSREYKWTPLKYDLVKYRLMKIKCQVKPSISLQALIRITCLQMCKVVTAHEVRNEFHCRKHFGTP